VKKDQTATDALAVNLKALMDMAHGGQGISQTQLAEKAGVAQTSIGYMLHPNSRQPTKKGRIPSPTLDSVDRVAKYFGKEAWQLLHPRPGETALNAKERAVYEEAMSSISRLRAIAKAR
jgi:transcriptional regulator with XRE-family HTH domain